MSREQYQIPTGTQQSVDLGAGAGGGGVTHDTSNQGRSSIKGSLSYICGDCAARVQLTQEAGIRCVKCGGRVLYKERTKR